MAKVAKEYVVKKIIGKKMKKGAVHYLVKWEGYPDEEDNTWEPESNLSCPDKVLEFESQINKDNKKSTSRTARVGRPASKRAAAAVPSSSSSSSAPSTATPRKRGRPSSKATSPTKTPKVGRPAKKRDSYSPSPSPYPPPSHKRGRPPSYNMTSSSSSSPKNASVGSSASKKRKAASSPSRSSAASPAQSLSTPRKRGRPSKTKEASSSTSASTPSPAKRNSSNGGGGKDNENGRRGSSDNDSMVVAETDESDIERASSTSSTVRNIQNRRNSSSPMKMIVDNKSFDKFNKQLGITARPVDPELFDASNYTLFGHDVKKIATFDADAKLFTINISAKSTEGKKSPFDGKSSCQVNEEVAMGRYPKLLVEFIKEMSKKEADEEEEM